MIDELLGQKQSATAGFFASQSGLTQGQGFKQLLQPQSLLIPMGRDDWQKLNRDTQIAVLDELGILNPSEP